MHLRGWQIAINLMITILKEVGSRRFRAPSGDAGVRQSLLVPIVPWGNLA